MVDDGNRLIIILARTRGPALLAFNGISQRMLRGALGNPDTLQADMQARIVHHCEHTCHAAIFRPNEPTYRAVIFTKRHNACGACMNAQLFFKADTGDIIARTQ